MGTNYYKTNIEPLPDEDYYDTKYEEHIGKRSAAGLYCWDCKTTLCVEGEERIHYESKWHKTCPKCGAEYEEEGLDKSSAGRELGFNKGPYSEHKGVKSISSFTWAIEPQDFIADVDEIWNEYGDKFTREEFMEILDNCPVRYTDLIGREFS